MSLIAELKRRNVFRVGVAYAIVAWLLVEVASVVLPALRLPEWTLTLLVFFVVAGFPLALIVAWAFELTPEGIKREAEVDRTESITHVTGRKLDFAIIGLLVLAVVYFAVDKFVLQADRIPATGSIGQVKTIAVLPFANMSGDPDQEFFSDGISEELLNVLAKVKGLRVTSRTSAFAFKGTNTSIPEIAEKLGVKHVLEGSVRMAGDRVRITAQLIEVETDSHLWSESYDRDLSNIFAVQDEIAAKVGEALKVALLGADSRPIRPSRETSIDVYSDYLLARQKVANISYHNLAEAERLLKGVIERDPNYAPGYAALADTYWTMANWGMFSSSETPERILPLVDKALSLDNRMAEVWQHLADVRQTNGDLEGARAAKQRALELDPQDPAVLRSQILSWSWTHEPERGLSFADELLRRDPLSPSSINRVATLYERLGRFDDAQRILDRMYSIDPQDPVSLWRISQLTRKVGDLATTLRLQQEVNRLDPYDPELLSMIARTYFDLGDVAAAESWKNAALRRDSESPQVKAVAALLHFVRDEEAEAVAIARELTAPNSFNRWGSRGIALRIVAAPELAAGDYEEIIARYLTHYPELADGTFPSTKLLIPDRPIWEAFLVTLDLASVYLHAGDKVQAELLLSLVETELPHWPRAGASIWGYGIADVALHALRGDKERALAALQEHVKTGTREMWRWELLYNPNLDSIRETPEFAAFVAEMEADMAAQLARVREMERNGELEPIPEVSAATQ